MVGLRTDNDGFPVRLLGRALIGGYRAADVRILVASLRDQLRQMAGALDAGWQERERLHTEVAALRAEVEHLRARATGAEELAATRAETLEVNARAAAARVLAEAEEQASRLRAEAAQRVGDAVSGVDEVLRVREQLLGELHGVLDTYTGLLQHVEGGRSEAVPGAVPHAVTSPPKRDADVYAGRIELDAGPFADFAELAAFERNLAGLPNVADVHILRFTQDRAEIELVLARETAFADDLETRLPHRLALKVVGDGRLEVDLRREALTG